MTSRISLTWETFKAEVVQPGLPAAIALTGDPPIRLFVTEHSACLGIMFPAGPAITAPVSPLRQVSVRTVTVSGQQWVQVVTTEPDLYREFFFFALSVADLVDGRDAEVLAAVEEALGSWRRLLQEAGRLSPEEEIGLIGELLVLARLIDAAGVSALEAWTAPGTERSRATDSSAVPDPHDFRLGASEIEVKTTRMSSRVHVIHGLAQLAASPGMSLYIASIQLEPAGASDGVTLPELVAAVRTKLAADPDVKRFDTMLARRARYDDADAHLYGDRYRLRSKPRVVPVEDGFPVLTRAALELAVRPEALPRILDVQYRVNVEGLGWEDGTPEFLAVIPEGRSA